MSDIKMIDAKGDSWYRNNGEFRMPHGERNGVFFEPGVATRVDADEWIKNQPVLELIDNPLGDDPKPKAEKAPK